MTRSGLDDAPLHWTSIEERALVAFRIAVACLMALLAFEWATRLYTLSLTVTPPGKPYALLTARSLAAFAILWFGLFGVTSWATTGRIEGGRPSRRAVLLLVFQLFVGWGGSFELLVLVALQAPFLLSGRPLVSFVGVIGLLPLGAGILELALAGFQVPPGDASPGFSRLPPLVGWGLTNAYMLAWMGFGASAGWMVARAVRSWRELLRVNAELRASRELLSESARIAERLHVSRELHDVLGHHLAALSQQLELARRRSEGDAAEAVARARGLVLRLLQRLRSAVSTLRRPATLELGRALRTLAGASEVTTLISIPDDLRLAPVRTEALFRCACAALGSAVLAGGRRNVSLEVRRRPLGHVLAVSVDPAAPALRPSEETLEGLRESLRPLGGALEATLNTSAFRMQVDLPDGEALP